MSSEDSIDANFGVYSADLLSLILVFKSAVVRVAPCSGFEWALNVF